MNTKFNKLIVCFTIGIISLCGIGIAKAAELNAFWVQGTAASLESPTSGITLNKFGWGAVYTVPSSISGTSAWGHIPIPTPVILHGIRSKLNQILVQYNGNAKIDRVDVWDGPNKIASRAVNWTGDHRTFGNWGVISFPTPPEVLYGIGVSFHISNNCTAGTVCPKQTMNVVSMGGDFLD